MAALSLVFDILARDRASRELGNVGDAADRAGSRVGAIGKMAGAAALGGVAALGAGLVATFKGGLDELKGNQEAMAQFTAGIKSTGGAANVSAEQMQSLADSIEAKTGSDGAAIVSGGALLATFTKVRDEVGKGNDVFSRATQAGVDLAARGFGSVEGNAVLLGKALNDPIKGLTALGKQGVTFTAGQKATIESLVKTGDVLGAQKIILKEIEGQVGGSAEAYGKTLPGQVARASAAFDGVKETVVKALLPALTGILTFLNDKLLPGFASVAERVGPAFDALGPILADIATKFGEIVQGVAGFIGAIPLPVLAVVGAALAVIGGAMAAIAIGSGIAAAATSVFAAAQGALNAVLALNPIVLIVAALAALVVGLVYAYRESETFRDIVDGAFSMVKKVAGEVMDFFTDTIPKTFSAMIDAGQELADFFTETIPAAFNAVKKDVTEIVDGVKTFLSDAWGSIKDTVDTSWEAIKGALGAAFEAIRLAFTTYFDAYKTVVTTVWTAITDAVPAAWNAVKTALETAFGLIKTAFTTALTGYQTAVANVWAAIAGAVDAAWDAIKTALVTAVGVVEDAFGISLQPFVTLISNMWSAIANTVQAAWTVIQAAIDTAVGLVKTAFSGDVAGFVTIIAGVWTSIKTAIPTAFSNIGTAIKNAFTGKGGLIDKMTGFGGDIIDAMVGGIGKAAHKVENAVKNILDKLPGISFNTDAKGDGPGAVSGGGATLRRVQSMLPSGLRVTSTYRSPADNARAGGSPTSYHMDRNNPAVDIAGTSGQLDSFYRTLQAIGGWRELLWRVPGHFDHIHVAHAGGTVGQDWHRSPGDGADERTTRLQVGETVLAAGDSSSLVGLLQEQNAILLRLLSSQAWETDRRMQLARTGAL